MADDTASSRKVVAIIQARMGSRRFPGKVLADLVGRPVLEWVVDAVTRVEGVDDIVVATTTNAEDQAIEDWCAEYGVKCFRGEPLDVLKRYADCAKEYSATYILRITADCPLLDPATVSAVLRKGLASGADYFGLAGEFPDGFDCEGFHSDALNRANAQSTLASDREHVTPFMKSNPNDFSFLPIEVWSGFGDVRLTIDEPEDLAYVRELALLSDLSGNQSSAERLLGLVRMRPDLRILNSHVMRNEGYTRSVSLD